MRSLQIGQRCLQQYVILYAVKYNQENLAKASSSFLAGDAVARCHQERRNKVFAGEVGSDHEQVVGGGARQQAREELRVEGFHGAAKVDHVNDDQERGDDDRRGRQLVHDAPSVKWYTDRW